MDGMPGMIRPDLQALPQVKDRIFSPHMRGGSQPYHGGPEEAKLFPAYAGVIPVCWKPARPSAAFPRTCGGDPLPTRQEKEAADFSPHTRG